LNYIIIVNDAESIEVSLSELFFLPFLLDNL